MNPYMANEGSIPEMGYWGFKGRAEPIRILLAYLNVNYTEASFTNNWPAKKDEILATGQVFANLPYYRDINGYVCETQAILEYIPRSMRVLDLLGKSEDDKVTVTMLWGVLGDLHSNFFARYSTSISEESAKKDFEETWKEGGKFWTKLKGLSDRLTSNNGFLMVYITIPDFIMFDLMALMDAQCKGLKIKSNPLDDITGLRDFQKKFSCLSGIKNYLASEKACRALIPQQFTKIPC